MNDWVALWAVAKLSTDFPKSPFLAACSSAALPLHQQLLTACVVVILILILRDQTTLKCAHVLLGWIRACYSWY